ncbi:hypothetical protein Tco_1074249 [Tanacetum coccineum]
MSDSEHSTVTYTSVSEDDSDIGSPGVDGPPIMPEVPPSPDYVPGPEEPEQAPPSPIYIPFVPEPVYPEFLPVDDEVFPAEEQPMPAADSPTHQSPGYIPESDPEEDPEEEDPEEESSDDDDDAEEEEHLAPADPAAVAYSADQDPYLAYRITARMSIRPYAPAPFLSEEVAERLLALPTPPLSLLSPYSSPLPQIPSPPLPLPSQPPNSPTHVNGSLGSRAAGIRQRDALPSPVHETEMLEISETDLYGFADMLDAAPGCQTSKELGYGITDTWDDLVGAIQEIAPTTLEGVNQRVTELATTVDQEDEIIYSQLDDARHDRALLRARVNMFRWMLAIRYVPRAYHFGLRSWLSQSGIAELQAADHQRQRQLVEALKIVKSLKTQMIELQRQQGPTKDPTEPELPEEASSSS